MVIKRWVFNLIKEILLLSCESMFYMIKITIHLYLDVYIYIYLYIYIITKINLACVSFIEYYVDSLKNTMWKSSPSLKMGKYPLREVNP